MLTFIIGNLGTIVVGLLVAAALGAIIVSIVKDRRQGKCPGCSTSCGNCAGSSCGTDGSCQ